MIIPGRFDTVCGWNAEDIRLLRSRIFFVASSVLYTFDSSGVIKLPFCWCATVNNNRMIKKFIRESNEFMGEEQQISSGSSGVVCL